MEGEGCAEEQSKDQYQSLHAVLVDFVGNGVGPTQGLDCVPYLRVSDRHKAQLGRGVGTSWDGLSAGVKEEDLVELGPLVSIVVEDVLLTIGPYSPQQWDPCTAVVCGSAL